MTILLSPNPFQYCPSTAALGVQQVVFLLASTYELWMAASLCSFWKYVHTISFSFTATLRAWNFVWKSISRMFWKKKPTKGFFLPPFFVRTLHDADAHRAAPGTHAGDEVPLVRLRVVVLGAVQSCNHSRDIVPKPSYQPYNGLVGLSLPPLQQ